MCPLRKTLRSLRKCGINAFTHLFLIPATMKKHLFLLLFCTWLFGCQNEDPAPDPKSSITVTWDGARYRSSLLQLGNSQSISDGFSIEEAAQFGSTLTLVVNYLGGCSPHQFELLGPEEAPTNGELRLILIHKRLGDTCTRSRFETLTFNLANNPLGLNSNQISQLNLRVVNGVDNRVTAVEKATTPPKGE